MLMMSFSLAYLALGVAVVGLEMFGVLSKRRGDTITENWRWVDAVLKKHGMVQWFWRVGTIGFLMWCILHFAGVW